MDLYIFKTRSDLTIHTQVIETNGLGYIMLNLVNAGFEHEVQISVDKHKIALVANDGGFVHPEIGDVSLVHLSSRHAF